MIEMMFDLIDTFCRSWGGNDQKRKIQRSILLEIEHFFSFLTLKRWDMVARSDKRITKNKQIALMGSCLCLLSLFLRKRQKFINIIKLNCKEKINKC